MMQTDSIAFQALVMRTVAVNPRPLLYPRRYSQRAAAGVGAVTITHAHLAAAVGGKLTQFRRLSDHLRG